MCFKVIGVPIGASLMSFGLIDSDVMVGSSSLVAIRLSEALASSAS